MNLNSEYQEMGFVMSILWILISALYRLVYSDDVRWIIHGTKQKGKVH